MPFFFQSINHALGLLFLEGHELKRQIGRLLSVMDFVIFGNFCLRRMNGWEGVLFETWKVGQMIDVVFSFQGKKKVGQLLLSLLSCAI